MIHGIFNQLVSIISFKVTMETWILIKEIQKARNVYTFRLCLLDMEQMDRHSLALRGISGM